MTAADLPTRASLHFAPARIGRATIAYDRDARVYHVSAPGLNRVTRNFARALDLAVTAA